MSDYEIFAFDPRNIAGFRPQRHQTRTRDAKQHATRMLEQVAAGARICCSHCDRELRSSWCRRIES